MAKTEKNNKPLITTIADSDVDLENNINITNNVENINVKNIKINGYINKKNRKKDSLNELLFPARGQSKKLNIFDYKEDKNLNYKDENDKINYINIIGNSNNNKKRKNMNH